jgi:2-amino-4-hydroxy-6-hydroxymethyldihydropteridine diphosphokinase
MADRIFVLLGSNLGNRLSNLSAARDKISRQVGSIVTSSSLYKTSAWGNTSQPDFVNQVVELESNHSPQALLNSCLEIEESLGRIRNEKWEPRTIDIDLLFYGSQVIRSPSLSVPHPEIHNRRFTLIPLDEISPDFVHPVLKKKISQLLTECVDRSNVSRLES